jgi:hypothetical protein
MMLASVVKSGVSVANAIRCPWFPTMSFKRGSASVIVVVVVCFGSAGGIVDPALITAALTSVLLIRVLTVVAIATSMMNVGYLI